MFDGPRGGSEWRSGAPKRAKVVSGVGPCDQPRNLGGTHIRSVDIRNGTAMMIDVVPSWVGHRCAKTIVLASTHCESSQQPPLRWLFYF